MDLDNLDTVKRLESAIEIMKHAIVIQERLDNRAVDAARQMGYRPSTIRTHLTEVYNHVTIEVYTTFRGEEEHACSFTTTLNNFTSVERIVEAWKKDKQDKEQLRLEAERELQAKELENQEAHEREELLRLMMKYKIKGN
jgi:hypothetical protein